MKVTQPSVPPSISTWRADHIGAIAPSAQNTIPLIDPADVHPILPGIDLWDLWPLQNADGSTTLFNGASLWFVLCAPALPDPEARHDIVRIRLMTHAADSTWRDHGHALPDGFNPGSREWAGSALWHPEAGDVTLFYTVAGYPGEEARSFAQRLFQTTGKLNTDDFTITGWSAPHENIIADNVHYTLVNQREGAPGFIKGFRDPAHFRDPKDGATYIVFTGSLKASTHAFNGCIGIARATNDALTEWQILPPILSADGLNNEQERPLLIHRGGHYYLFWSTQRKVFAPDGPSGPNGVYGAVADDVLGPWRPLNGTGLVAANPDDAPFQTYSWWVDADLDVWGFIDYPACTAETKVDDPAWRRAHFGGTPAPTFRIALDGDRAWVDQAGAEGQ
nr:glycoside hydrolase family 68 protein [Novosphingobium sediminicola]